MDKDSFVVDRRLGAVRLNKLLEVRGKLHSKGRVGNEGSTGEDRPVLKGDQLKPNELYPSSRYPATRYYLPQYAVALDAAGAPEVVLQFSGSPTPEPDVNAEVGKLTITLTWTPPTAPSGVTLRMIDHVAGLALRYRIPVQAEGGATPSDGGWEETIPLQPLQQLGDERAASETVFASKESFDKVYQALSQADRNAEIQISIVAPVAVRTWKQMVVGKVAEGDQAAALHRREALFTSMVNAETLATIQRRGGNTNRAKIQLKPEALEVTREIAATRAVLMSPALRREMSLVSAGRQPRVVAATRPGTIATTVNARVTPATAAGARVTPAASRRGAKKKKKKKRKKAQQINRTGTARKTKTVAAARARAKVATTRQPATVAMNATLATPLIVQPMMTARILTATVAPTARPAVTPVAHVNPAIATANVRPTAASADPKKRRAAKTLTRVNAPQLKAAVMASNFKIAGIRAVPLQLALDTKRQPALVDTDLENTQSLPFHFDPAQHRNVYATSNFTPGAPHILLPLLLASGQQVYQDNLMRDVVHVVPSEFRLVRDDDAPYLPTLSLLASDFGTTEDDVEAEVLFRIAMVYRLEPWIDPDVIDEARTALSAQGQIARFTSIVPRDATLHLELSGSEEERDEATIDPAIGITDALELDHEEFLTLWQSALGLAPGIRGRVAFTLFDGSSANAGVKISFWENSSDVFDTQFLGAADAPGRYKVLVRNRVESPVAIGRLPGEPVDNGGVALAVDAATLLGRVLQPQESVEVEYQVTPPDTPITSLSPPVLGETRPDLGMLLKVLMETSGYSALSFAVTVRAAEGVFGPGAPGAEPLSGILVEFDDGSRVELSADDDEADVTLVGRLVDQILGTADDEQRYFYRVTSLHPTGEGARSAWQERRGTEPLVVGTPVGTLDF